MKSILLLVGLIAISLLTVGTVSVPSAMLKGAKKISAVLLPDDRVDLFFVADDGTVWHGTQVAPNDVFSVFQPIGDAPDNTIDLSVVLKADGGREVFIVGEDGKMYQSVQNSAGTFEPFRKRHIGGPERAKAISALVLPNGRVELFIIGTDSGVWYSAQVTPNADFPDFKRIGPQNNIANDISAVAKADGSREGEGSREVFMVGTNEKIYQSVHTSAGTFEDFKKRPIVETYSARRISAVVLPNWRVDLFIVGTDARVWHSIQIARDDIFPDFARTPVGGDSDKARDIAAVLRRGGSSELFLVGTDSRLYHSVQLANGTFTEFCRRPIGGHSPCVTPPPPPTPRPIIIPPPCKKDIDCGVSKCCCFRPSTNETFCRSKPRANDSCSDVCR